MPNLPAHIDLACMVSKRLNHPIINGNIGHYMLGATSPDIRVITKNPREKYHFSRLDFKCVGEGDSALFAKYPHLSSEKIRGDSTISFLAGYITHLIVDECWIWNLYRPFFGNRDIFEDEVEGKVLDRALQLELDRQSFIAVDAVKGRINAATKPIDVGFIPQETIETWRKWVISSLDHNFTWERLRFMAQRISAGEKRHPAHKIANDFIALMPTSLQQLFDKIPEQTLHNFKQDCISISASRIARFLS